MDPICANREFSANNAARLENRKSEGQFAKRPTCKLTGDGSSIWIEVFRDKEQFCEEHKHLDLINRTKSVDDLSADVYCASGTNQEATKENYARIVGDKSPDQFVAELISLNVKGYHCCPVHFIG